MNITRPPTVALRSHVALVWATDDAGSVEAPQREHVLPTGAMHLVVRLSDGPLWLLDDAGRRVARLRAGIVGGARSRYYARELEAPSSSVGVVLRPGVSEALFGMPADELAERHTSLEDLWGAEARGLHERLLGTRDVAERCTLLESALLARLRRAQPMSPAVAAFIGRVDAFASIDAAVEASGFSHRHFAALVRRAAGLPPKTWQRVLRFQRALRAARAARANWAAIAHDAGYADQAHFSREFVAFAGVTPSAWRAAAPTHPNHVPVAAARRRR